MVWLLRLVLLEDEDPLEDERLGEELLRLDLDEFDLLDELEADGLGDVDDGLLLGRGDGVVVGWVEASLLAAVLRAWTAMASDSCSSTTPFWACWALSSAAVQASRS